MISRMKLGVFWLLLWSVLSNAAIAKAATPSLNLTANEQSYLNSLTEIRICSDPDWMPYEAIDDNGLYTGIMSDFHQLWAEKIGKPTRLVVTKDWAQSLAFMEQRRCDILSSAQDLPERRHFLSTTQPFIFYPFAVATQPDSKFIINLAQVIDERFAMVKGYAAVDMIQQHYPSLEIVSVDNAEQGLKKVEKGQVFAFIDTVPSINYQTLKHGISHIKINGVLDQQYAMSVGVRSDQAPLLAIYNKAIEATTDIERQSILNKWLSITFQYEFDYSVIWRLLIAVSIILMLLAYRYYVVSRHNQALQQVNKKLEKMSHSDQLTGIPNRHFLHYSFQLEQSKALSSQQPFSLVILDIDLFKAINDSFGHIVGDDIIKRVARLLVDNIRDKDNVGRWGGEEFLIICPNTELAGAKSLADDLRELIASYDFSLKNMPVTASFGVTEYKANEPMEECIKRADQGLYLAKQGGRNKVVVI